MNMVLLCGRICTVPKTGIIFVGGKQRFVCKLTIGVENGSYSLAGKMVDKTYDFVELIAFDKTAEHISKHFTKGSKIVTSGSLKNFTHPDANGTAHFTNIVLINSVEFGDTESVISNVKTRKSGCDVTIKADIQLMEEIFEKACEEGYYCIDENDYYLIATGNMEI